MFRKILNIATIFSLYFEGKEAFKVFQLARGDIIVDDDKNGENCDLPLNNIVCGTHIDIINLLGPSSSKLLYDQYQLEQDDLPPGERLWFSCAQFFPKDEYHIERNSKNGNTCTKYIEKLSHDDNMQEIEMIATSEIKIVIG